jgi:hypothetical protein
MTNDLLTRYGAALYGSGWREKGVAAMKRCLTAFAIAAILFTPLAARAADDVLMDQVRINAPIYALLLVCDLRAINAAAEHSAVLAKVKSDPEASALVGRLHRETQAAYIKARNAGKRIAFCKDFIAANSQYAKARVTVMAEGIKSNVNARVRAAVARDICGIGTAAKLSTKADKNEYASIRQSLQIEHKIAKEDAEMKGWSVADEIAAVTEQFCAAGWNIRGVT